MVSNGRLVRQCAYSVRTAIAYLFSAPRLVRKKVVTTAARHLTAWIILAWIWGLQAPGAQAGHFEERIQGITTPVISQSGQKGSQGSGFFYHQLVPRDAQKDGYQWRAVTGTWLVTNRHLVLPRSGEEEVPVDSFSFFLRQKVGDDLKWDEVKLSGDDLFGRAKFDCDEKIDVVVIDIKDLLNERHKSGLAYVGWGGVVRDDLPDMSPIGVEASDEILVIGYPRSFYDHKNLFPILKSGIIASAWNKDFDGEPYFLVDARLFPGSSGSIVISSPRNFRVDNGKPVFSETKKFVVLGVYSGTKIFTENPIELPGFTLTPKERLDLGIVWHSRLIEQIIDSGVRYDKKMSGKATCADN